ncbi:MAG: manno-octulosonate cytidylyltransferase [Pseudomonadota bacterium]
MKSVIIVPARYASSRFPGKPLAELTGADGSKKSLIQRSWEAAKAVDGPSVFVATDDTRIKAACLDFGADVIMTSETCRNGTERCADALQHLENDFDLVINLQGDAPLSPAWFVSDLIGYFENGGVADMATPVLRCSDETLANFKEDRKAGLVGGTTAVFNSEHRALYFSKEVLPYADAPQTPVFHHVGIYAYRPNALCDYLSWDESHLEKIEGLEQLRFLENNAHIHCQEVEARGREFWEVNNPEDVPRVSKVLQELGVS